MPGKLMNFDLPKGSSSIIKVIGVGGGGSNAVNHMFSQGIKGVDFVVCNTDSQDLDLSPVPHKIQLGAGLTEGLGAGGDPNVGKNSALENIEQIKEILETNTQMVFITAGMGGGTGTGGAPVIASIAKEMNILTVGIVTIPFSNEGPKRMQQAEEGLDRLRESVDAMIIICNDKLREMYGNLTLSTAFLQADNVLATAARGIAEMISVHGTINVDFRDVSTVMKDSGVAIMGSAIASGEDRAVKAVELALASPLLNDNKITGARYVLLNITTGKDEPLLDEITDISDYVQQEAGNIANVIMGVSTDESMGDDLGVTIIAAGFETNPDLGFVGAKQPERIVRSLNDPSQPTIVHQLDDSDEKTEEIEKPTPITDGPSGGEVENTVTPPVVETKPPVFPPVAAVEPTNEEHVIEDTPERKVFQLNMDDDDASSVASKKEEEEMKLVVKPEPTADSDQSGKEEVEDTKEDVIAKEETPTESVTTNEEEPSADTTEIEQSSGDEDLFDKPMASFEVTEGDETVEEEVVAEKKEEDTIAEVQEDVSAETEVKAEPSSEVKEEEPTKEEEKAAKKKQAELDAILNQFPAPPTKKEEPKNTTESKEEDTKATEENSVQEDKMLEDQETVGKVEEPVAEDESSEAGAKDDEIEEANIPEFKLMGDSDTDKDDTKSDFEFDLSADTGSTPSAPPSSLSSISDDDSPDSSGLSEGGSDLNSYSSPNSMNQDDRISKLKELSYKLRTPSGVSDLEDQPAYMRRNVDLDDVPHSSESEVSRYTLNDGEEGEDKVELKPDNPFLHDNVD